MKKVIKLQSIYGSPDGIKFPNDEVTVDVKTADQLVKGHYGVWVRDIIEDGDNTKKTAALSVDKATRSLQRKEVSGE